jgi:ABC-type dipeptide/oligopeptide/nickel transport system permease subunit
MRRDPPTALAALVVLLLIAASVVVPALSAYRYSAQDLEETSRPPGGRHWLGTDHLGRDILTRLAYGGRISFLVSGTAVLAHTTIGLTLGMTAGFLGGRTDGALMRLTDIVLAFPPLLFLILITGLLGASLGHIVLALSVVGWAGMARQVRAEALALRGREFVAAVRALGATDGRILLRHVLPNVITVALVRASLDIGPVILSEATLSFLGIGIQPPIPSWGVMISDAFKHLRSYPYQAIIPCLTLSGAILALTFLGEGIAEALDPRWRRR